MMRKWPPTERLHWVPTLYQPKKTLVTEQKWSLWAQPLHVKNLKIRRQCSKGLVHSALTMVSGERLDPMCGTQSPEQLLEVLKMFFLASLFPESSCCSSRSETLWSVRVGPRCIRLGPPLETVEDLENLGQTLLLFSSLLIQIYLIYSFCSNLRDKVDLCTT